ncbi:TPA: ABC transporter permease, partial [Yersinia enterocolitica]|nr:ABC transporter permease [Yersinia enterocolitica]
KVLNDFYAKLSYSQRSFLSGGNSPYSDETISVMATDKAGINLIMGDEFDDSLFEGNVAIYNNNNQDISDKPRMIFFNGVPFHIIGVKNKSKAEFLDSLGLSPNNSNEKYYIPLDTLFRFNLDNKIDNVQIIFDKDVTDEMSTAVKNKLKRNNIDKYMITTSLD